MNSELSQIAIAHYLLKEDTESHHSTSDRRQTPGISTAYRNASVLGASSVQITRFLTACKSRHLLNEDKQQLEYHLKSGKKSIQFFSAAYFYPSQQYFQSLIFSQAIRLMENMNHNNFCQIFRCIGRWRGSNCPWVLLVLSAILVSSSSASSSSSPTLLSSPPYCLHC